MSVVDLRRLTAVDLCNMSLNLVGDAFDKYVVLPSPEAHTAVTLWTLHTHVYDSFYITPRLNVSSNEPGSGKSLVLDILSHLVAKPRKAVNLTPGVLWHLLDEETPTVLFDEVDTMFGTRGSGSAYTILRLIINAGYQKGEQIPRLVGKGGTITWYDVFGPMALAGIGDLPHTILTRSIVIEMRKRKPTDPEVAEFDPEFASDELAHVREIVEAWAARAAEPLSVARPDVPASNRDAQLWRVLVAIADMAGGPWPDRARDACRALTAQRKPPVGLQLLESIREVFGEDAALETDELVSRLRWLPKSPFMHETFTGRTMSKMLKTYGIKSTTFRPGPGAEPVRGYKRDQFVVAWDRYLDEEPSDD